MGLSLGCGAGVALSLEDVCGSGRRAPAPRVRERIFAGCETGLDYAPAMPHLMATLLAQEALMSPIRPHVTVSVLIG